MAYNRIDLKNRAKELVTTSDPKPISVGLVYLAISIVIGFLSYKLIGQSFTEDAMSRYFSYIQSGRYEYALAYLESLEPPTSAYVINMVLNMVLSVVSAGFVIFLLNTIRNAKASFGNLFDGFGMFLKIIWLFILEGIFISLWSLLLVIPGIVAAYRYRMAIYLLLDHPELSALDCIRESKQMMAGHKGELFVLDLSFIGWLLLNSIPVVGYLVQIWTIPYRGMSYALYYETLRGADIYSRPIGGSNDRQAPPWEF